MVVEAGEPADVIAELAERFDAYLVVVGGGAAVALPSSRWAA